MFERSEPLINLGVSLYGAKGLIKSIKNIPSLLKAGSELKVAGYFDNILQSATSLSVNTDAVGALSKTRIYGLATGATTSNIIWDLSEGNIDNIGRDGFTKEQRKYYDDEIENASTDEIADKIRYERNKVSRENRGLKPYDSYDDWYKTVERIRILLFR